MKVKNLIGFCGLVTSTFFILVCVQTKKEEPSTQPVEKKAVIKWDFDEVSVGDVPEGWKIEGTRQEGPLATWKVIEDLTAPSGGKALALTESNHYLRKTFNLCWTDSVSFLDGEIEVKFKSVKGKIDQGGGIIWRVKDKDNYYIARFNPLENNFRFYYVIGGKRIQQLNADLTLPAGEWHTMKIVQKGQFFQGYLNGEKFLEGMDSTFTEAGGVGFWTKADAVTSFDDFLCTPKEAVRNGE